MSTEQDGSPTNFESKQHYQLGIVPYLKDAPDYTGAHRSLNHERLKGLCKLQLLEKECFTRRV